MIGHSKGGAEAMYNAIATNTNCITFNPAPTNFAAYGLSSQAQAYRANLANGSRTMTHYVIRGEMLNWVFGSSSIGKTVPIDTQYWFNPTFTILWWTLTSRLEPDRLKNHSVDAFFKAWRLRQCPHELNIET